MLGIMPGLVGTSCQDYPTFDRGGSSRGGDLVAGGGGFSTAKNIVQLDNGELQWLPLKLGRSLWTTGSTFLLELGLDRRCIEIPESS